MAASRFDFVRKDCGGAPCEAGATFSHQIGYEEEFPLHSNEFKAVDLSGWSAKMHVRESEGSPIIIELTTENNRITLGGTNGLINLLISAADTNGLEPGKYRYDLELDDGAGAVIRLLYGIFEVVGQITV